MGAIYDRIISYLDDDIARADLKAAGIYDRRIQRSLAKYHRKEFWQRDIVETPVIFPNQNLSLQTIDLRDFPRQRKIAYIREYDPTGINTNVTPAQQGIAGEHFKEISLPFSVDYFGWDVNYVFYRAGELVNLRSKCSLKAVLFGYFVDPILEPVANISSWIAELYPDLIAADCKYRIFADIGKDEEKKEALIERGELELTLFANNIYSSYQKG